MLGLFKRKAAAPPDSHGTPAVPAVRFTPEAHQQMTAVLGRQAEAAAVRIVVKNPGAGAPQYDMALEAASQRSAADIVLDAGGLLVVTDARSLAAVDGATIQFQNDPLRPGFTIEAPRHEVPAAFDASDPLAAQVQSVLVHHVNPSIASHGGSAQLVGVKDDVVYLALSGGCQGCSMASVTLTQGIEQTLRQAIPRIRAVVDATDHAQGNAPYYAEGAAGASATAAPSAAAHSPLAHAGHAHHAHDAHHAHSAG